MARAAVGLSRRNTHLAPGGSGFPGPPDLQVFDAVTQGGGVQPQDRRSPPLAADEPPRGWASTWEMWRRSTDASKANWGGSPRDSGGVEAAWRVSGS